MPEHTNVVIDAGEIRLDGMLLLPPDARAVVAVAHGSGSTRFSSRNRAVASLLYDAGLGTLLFDLLTESESTSRDNVFDIELLASRLAAATAFLRDAERTSGLPIAYFGASTGGAAALLAAAADHRIASVVSRGGRPDLVGERLAEVTAPTLLIVGSLDDAVIELNARAYERLRCEKHLEIVPGAGHLFEEPGTLAQMADHARRWFLDHAPAPAGSSGR